MQHAGGCLCGAVRFVCEGAPVNVRVCHCRLCQRAFSAPFNARAFYDQSNITLTGELITWPTSDRIDRKSCARCGARVITWRKDGSGAGVPLAAFDQPQTFSPTEHIWVSERLPWLTLADGLPQYEEGIPA